MTPSVYEATMSGTGRIPWAAARELLSGAACAWADLGGLHLWSPPATAPLTTHLWAWWADGRTARARLDEDAAYLAILASDQDPVFSVPGLTTARVTVHHHPDARLWQRSDPQAGPLPPEFRGLAFELAEVSGPSPAAFVRVRG